MFSFLKVQKLLFIYSLNVFYFKLIQLQNSKTKIAAHNFQHMFFTHNFNKVYSKSTQAFS